MISGRILLVTSCSLALSVSACRGGNVSPDASGTADPSAEATEAASAPQVRVDYRGIDEFQNITATSDEDKPITVKTITLNDLPDDQDCHLKVFKVLKKGESVKVPAGKCGNILKISLETDRGKVEQTYDPKQGTLTWSFSDGTMYVTNTSTDEMKLNRVVYNGREKDPSCDIKIFKILAPEQQIPVPSNGCGEINKVKFFFNYNDKDLESDNDVS